MADEATVTTTLAFAKGSVSTTISDSAQTYDVSGTKYVKGVQNVGTSEEALDMGSITSPGWCYMRNLDATNFVSVRPATAETDLIKIKPGEHICFRMIATAPYVIADTSTVDLEYLIVED